MSQLHWWKIRIGSGTHHLCSFWLRGIFWICTLGTDSCEPRQRCICRFPCRRTPDYALLISWRIPCIHRSSVRRSAFQMLCPHRLNTKPPLCDRQWNQGPTRSWSEPGGGEGGRGVQGGQGAAARGRSLGWWVWLTEHWVDFLKRWRGLQTWLRCQIDVRCCWPSARWSDVREGRFPCWRRYCRVVRLNAGPLDALELLGDVRWREQKRLAGRAYARGARCWRAAVQDWGPGRRRQGRSVRPGTLRHCRLFPQSLETWRLHRHSASYFCLVIPFPHLMIQTVFAV